MEAGDFNGHGKLPRLSSSSVEKNHQGLASDQPANGRPTSGTNNNNGTGSEDHYVCMVREQDQLMPIANVIRLMRKALPPHAKIADDAKETVQECVSEFISFVTSEANERCQLEQRKTVTSEDLLWAMAKLGFDDYVEPLTLYLRRYREFEGDRPPLRADSLPKRNYDYTPRVGLAAPPPGFHMVAQPHHPAGYYGPPPPPPASNSGGGAAQQGGAPGFGPYGQQGGAPGFGPYGQQE